MISIKQVTNIAWVIMIVIVDYDGITENEMLAIMITAMHIVNLVMAGNVIVLKMVLMCSI